jgi:hypothetical protein
VSIASDGVVLLNGLTTTVAASISSTYLFQVEQVGVDSYAVTVPIGGGGGGGTPGGSTTQVQYNAGAGNFGGVSGVTSNGTTLSFITGALLLLGSTSGTVTLNAPATGGGTLTLPAGTDTLVSLTATQTLTNKTLTAANLDTPTVITLTNATGLPLTTGVTGILGPANGGTGVANNAASTMTISGNFATTLTVTGTTAVTLPTSGTLMVNPMTTGGDIVYGGASGVPTRLANGTAGQVLTSNGTTLAPSWQAAGSGSGLTINTSAITGGTTTRLLYDNAATVGETANLTVTTNGLGFSGAVQLYWSSGNADIEVRNFGDSAYVPIRASIFQSSGGPAVNTSQVLTNAAEMNNTGFRGASQVLNLLAASGIAWNASTAFTAPDTGLQRIAAGVVGFGVGTAASVAGSFQALSAGLGTAILSSATLAITAGTTAKAQVNFASSTAPTSPNDGDFWYDGTNVKIRVGGTTKTFTLI